MATFAAATAAAMPDTTIDITKPPFVLIDGVFNARVVGGYPITDDGKKVKEHIFYRSGELSSITPEGQKILRDELNVRQIFDTRSDWEVLGYKAREVDDIPGVAFERVKLVKKAPRFEPTDLGERLKLLETDELKTFTLMAQEVLESLGPVFEKVVRYMNEHPAEPCIIHCTAGKDRTGLTSAMLLKLLGAPDDIIAQEYSLTTAGIAPAIELLSPRLAMLPVFKDNPNGTRIMGNSKSEYMIEVLDIVRREWGSPEGYLKANTDLTEDEITKFKALYTESFT